MSRRQPTLAPDLLAIDVGNSKVLAVLLRDSHEVFRWRVPFTSRRSLWERSFLQATRLARRSMGAKVPTLLASVAPQRGARVEALLRQAGVRSFQRVTWKDPWPFRLDLRHPQGVGPDRLANVAGLVALGVRQGIAVDVGTAVTIDVLRRGAFAGGLILPGAAMMALALHRGTALLPAVAWRPFAPLVGRDTEEAMRAGISHALIQAIRGISQDLLVQLGKGATAVITGGAAAEIAGTMPLLRHEPDLLLLGLRLLAARRAVVRRHPLPAAR